MLLTRLVYCCLETYLGNLLIGNVLVLTIGLGGNTYCLRFNTHTSRYKDFEDEKNKSKNADQLEPKCILRRWNNLKLKKSAKGEEGYQTV